MDKREKVVALCIVGMLALNSCQVYQLQKDVDALQSSTQNMINNLQDDVRSLEGAASAQERRIEELLTKQASLFSKTSINYSLQGKQLAVTMQGIPKELKNNETLVARITANGKTYEQPADANHQATLLIEPAETIQPSFIIKSANGVRQEALNEEYPLDYLTIPLECAWREPTQESPEGQAVLDIYLAPQDTTIPLQAEDIAKVECIVVNTGIVNGRSQVPPETAAPESVHGFNHEAEETAFPKGDIVPAVKVNDNGKLHYQADFTNYAERKDGIQYEIYLLVTSKDGMRFRNRYNDLASFSYDKDSSSSSSGGGELYPVFE